MLAIKTTRRFDKDYVQQAKRKKDLGKLQFVMGELVNERKLDAKYRDHQLVGRWVGRRECHIEPDWLLIYKLDAETVIFERTGTHSDLFG
jgi:mRNA interferase YafQ